MDKETLSNYGWIVICVIVLSVMIALATPFATEIKNAVVTAVNGLVKHANGALEGIASNMSTIEDQFVSAVDGLGSN